MEIKERGILMKGPLVLKTLADIKTQTRRLNGLERVNESPDDWAASFVFRGQVQFHNGPSHHPSPCSFPIKCPYGMEGDRLWVRESCHYSEFGMVHYRADMTEEQAEKFRWRPSIHMHRWACRLVLEITSIRVERLNDITEADAEAEGAEIAYYMIDDQPTGSYDEGFARLWESINGKGSWKNNPWVWVVEYRRIDSHKHRNAPA